MSTQDNGGRGSVPLARAPVQNPGKCLDYITEACRPILRQTSVGTTGYTAQGATVRSIWAADQISRGCYGVRIPWKGNLNDFYSAPSQAGGQTQTAAPKWSKLKALDLLLMLSQNPLLLCGPRNTYWATDLAILQLKPCSYLHSEPVHGSLQNITHFLSALCDTHVSAIMGLDQEVGHPLWSQGFCGQRKLSSTTCFFWASVYSFVKLKGKRAMVRQSGN